MWGPNRASARYAAAMATGMRHPHAPMPSTDELRELIARLQPQHEALYPATHGLVLDAVRDARCVADRASHP